MINEDYSIKNCVNMLSIWIINKWRLFNKKLCKYAFNMDNFGWFEADKAIVHVQTLNVCVRYIYK